MGDRNAYVWACDDKTYVEEVFPNAFHDNTAWRKVLARLLDRHFTNQTTRSERRANWNTFVWATDGKTYVAVTVDNANFDDNARSRALARLLDRHFTVRATRSERFRTSETTI